MNLYSKVGPCILYKRSSAIEHAPSRSPLIPSRLWSLLSLPRRVHMLGQRLGQMVGQLLRLDHLGRQPRHRAHLGPRLRRLPAQHRAVDVRMNRLSGPTPSSAPTRTRPTPVPVLPRGGTGRLTAAPYSRSRSVCRTAPPCPRSSAVRSTTERLCATRKASHLDPSKGGCGPLKYSHWHDRDGRCGSTSRICDVVRQ